MIRINGYGKTYQDAISDSIHLFNLDHPNYGAPTKKAAAPQ
jgi:hypothetical protein